MASVELRQNPKGKTYRIRLSEGEHPDRPRIGLGKVSKKDAMSACGFIENLICYCNTGKELKPDTQKWLQTIRPFVRKRLEALELIETTPDSTESHTVESWCKKYITMRKNDGQTKSDTVRKLENVSERLSLFFKNIPLESVTKLEAKNFRAYLSGKVKLSDNTVRRHIGIVRQFFNAAIEARIVTRNPFLGQPVTVQANKARFYFVTTQEAQSVLDACPDAQWRLIFGLARFGGLRCPSEIVRLKWQDVDFEYSRFTVHSSKTEHHADGGIRTVPIFPELKPLFQDAFDQANEGAVYCLDRYNGQWSNLGTNMKRIVKKAGLTPWPKLFQNCRSTRETELFKLTGNIKAVCEWIGNSPTVAMQHYAQITEQDMKQAAKLAVLDDAEKTLEKGGVNRGQTVAVTPEIGRKERQEKKHGEDTTLLNATIYEQNKKGANLYESHPMGVTGLEPVTPSLSSWCSSQLS